jgi:hypothetical protein
VLSEFAEKAIDCCEKKIFPGMTAILGADSWRGCAAGIYLRRRLLAYQPC